MQARILCAALLFSAVWIARLSRPSARWLLSRRRVWWKVCICISVTFVCVMHTCVCAQPRKSALPAPVPDPAFSGSDVVFLEGGAGIGCFWASGLIEKDVCTGDPLQTCVFKCNVTTPAAPAPAATGLYPTFFVVQRFVFDELHFSYVEQFASIICAEEFTCVPVTTWYRECSSTTPGTCGTAYSYFDCHTYTKGVKLGEIHASSYRYCF